MFNLLFSRVPFNVFQHRKIVVLRTLVHHKQSSFRWFVFLDGSFCRMYFVRLFIQKSALSSQLTLT